RKTDVSEPLSRCCEVLDGVTPARLRVVLTSTLKARSAEPTQELIIRGNHRVILRWPLSARKIKDLAKACPCIKQLSVEQMNLRASGRNRCVSLEHFPSTLTTLSIRDSLVEVNTFLRTTQDPAFTNMRVLDLGGTINACGANYAWPPMENLEELYLEGARGLSSVKFLQNILVNCPALKAIDLEGTDVDSDVMVTLASFANHLRKIFLGFTDLRDSGLYALNQRNLVFRSLEVLCLADTTVSQLGLDQLRRSAPKLREVTVNRCVVLEDVQDDDVFLPLRVYRIHNVHIGAVFRNRGCEHFKAVHSRRHASSKLKLYSSKRTKNTMRRIGLFV
ncbi:hypothetical protein BIW11_11298, partial [Tropilaelaps mercedesae]